MSKSPTPFFDPWRAAAADALSERGSKAELARYLSAQYGHDERTWQTQIAHILSGRQVPNAETYLAIEHWIHQKHGRVKDAGSSKRT
ncbi:MAG: hypothetical protein V4710_04750 [Verrucomicrobiota bacterium]